MQCIKSNQMRLFQTFSVILLYYSDDTAAAAD